VAKSKFFIDDPATDPAYINVRAAENAFTRKARQNCEELWEIFEPHADPEFLIEIRDNFDARYWEMYLAVFLIRKGYDVYAPKPGPDIGIRFLGCRIWFEATCPERGAAENLDQVPDLRVAPPGEVPVVQDTPNEQLVLRYLNSISVKQQQWDSWLKHRIVAPEDAYVVAINPRRLRHEFGDTDPPRILQAAHAIGPPYIALDPKTGEPSDVGYQFRDKIKRKSGAEVSTGVFLMKEYANLSGLLCSRIDVANQPEKMGLDFQLVENRWVKAPMPDWFRLEGTFFRIDYTGDGYVAVPEVH
jgi:hypothetical protein